MSINPPTANDLGVIITSPRIRRVIYAVYVIALIIATATQIAYAALQLGQPAWLVAALAVLAYLGIPVATLAVANTSPTPAVALAPVRPINYASLTSTPPTAPSAPATVGTAPPDPTTTGGD